MKRAGSDLPPDSHEAMIAGGGAALREELSVLTKAQAERLFRSAYMAARSAEQTANRAWEEWLEARARDRSAEETRQAEAEERKRAEEDEAAARARSTPPGPGDRRRLPHDILGLPASATRDLINARWRKLAAQHHPDRTGGDAARMAEINSARDDMLRRAAA